MTLIVLLPFHFSCTVVIGFSFHRILRRANGAEIKDTTTPNYCLENKLLAANLKATLDKQFAIKNFKT